MKKDAKVDPKKKGKVEEVVEKEPE